MFYVSGAYDQRDRFVERPQHMHALQGLHARVQGVSVGRFVVVVFRFFQDGLATTRVRVQECVCFFEFASVSFFRW